MPRAAKENKEDLKEGRGREGNQRIKFRDGLREERYRRKR